MVIQTPAIRPPPLFRRSFAIGEHLEESFYRSNAFTAFGASIILGMLVLYLSCFAGIDEIVVTHGTIKKQLGIWYAPNWSIVYLVLFPLYLVCLSRQASFVRGMLDRAVQTRSIVTSNGAHAEYGELIACLKKDFASTTRIFVLLALVTAVVALGGWYIACYGPIRAWAVGDQVVTWSTAPIDQLDPKYKMFQTPLLAYTFIAYLWMGLALFIYVACLFVNFIYSNFFHKLASGQIVTNDGYVFQVVSRTDLPNRLSEYLYNFLAACFLGLIAAFLMRLEVAYVYSDKPLMSQFWFNDWTVVQEWKDSLLGSIDLPAAHFQPDGAKNQTQYTSMAVIAATFVAFGASWWLVQASLRAARAYTVSIAQNPDFLARIGLQISAEDLRTLQNRDEMLQVFPNLKTATILCGGVIFCTLFPRFGLLFSAFILFGIYRYLLRALRRAADV